MAISMAEKERYQRYLCSREWSERREAVLKRSDGLCERCWNATADAVHHLTYARKYNEAPEDLQAICDPCHKFTHGKSDVDPVRFAPPFLGGYHQLPTRSVYLAGKISGDNWRNDLMDGWSAEQSGIGSQETLEWGSRPIRASSGKWIECNGPFWCPLGRMGGHGNTFEDTGGHHLCGHEVHDEKHGSYVVTPFLGIRKAITKAISESDLVFAWIDSPDCFGTLAELGYAWANRTSVNRPYVIVATPMPFRELWLGCFMSDFQVIEPSPKAAWDLIWTPELFDWGTQRFER